LPEAAKVAVCLRSMREDAATNMHQLTGDFYSTGEILGHTLKGVGLSLGISTSLDAVTAQYVNVRLDRKRIVPDVCHTAPAEAKTGSRAD